MVGRRPWHFLGVGAAGTLAVQPTKSMARSMYFLMLLLAALSVSPAESIVARVSQPVQKGTVSLLAALADPAVDRIVLSTDVTLSDQDFGERVLVVNHSVTVTSAPGTAPLLDFNFMRGKFIIGRPHKVVFKDIVLQNTRKVPGLGIEPFSGASDSGNSTRFMAEVYLVNVLRLRLFCPNSNITLASLTSYPRPTGYGTGGQDSHLVQGVCFRTECYDDALRSEDFITTIQPLESEETGYLDPYVLVQRNVTQACRWRVPDSCVQLHGADGCVLSQLEDYLQAQRQPANNSRAQLVTLAAAIGTAGGVILLVILGAAVWVCRRRRDLQAAIAAAEAKVIDVEASQPVKLRSGTNSTQHGSSDASRDLMCVSRPLLGAHTGKSSVTWQVVAVHSATELQGQELPTEVQLGVLMGAGSFGRVYAGRWAGRRVAVKVLQHNAASARPVMNEVHLMLSFSHPNVVKGYHFICWGRMSELQRLALQQPAGPKPADSATSMEQVQLASDRTGSSGSSQASSSQGNSLSTHNSHCGVDTALSGPHAIGVHPQQQQQQQQQQQTPPADAVLSDFRVALGGEGGTACGSDSSLSPSAMDPLQRATPSDREMEAWLIQEYCDGGTLLDSSQQWRSGGPDEFLKRILVRLREVASGMRYLHERCVIHGDLKGNNILLSRSMGPYGMTAKVSDFGLSRALDANASFRQTQTLGTVTHAAPEQLRTGKLSAAVDVYAFGILMWELYTGQVAFKDMHVAEVIQRVALQDERPAIPGDMPDDYKLLMTSCWSTDAADRPSFDSVLTCIQLMLQSIMEGLPEAPSGADMPLVSDL